MTLFALPSRRRAPRLSSMAKRFGKLKKPPRADSAPTRSVSRRVSPLQLRRGLPRTVITALPSCKIHDCFNRASRRLYGNDGNSRQDAMLPKTLFSPPGVGHDTFV